MVNGAVAVADPAKELAALAGRACDNAAKHYEDYHRTYFAFDSKAQSTATVAGVEIAALVSLLKPEIIQLLLKNVGSLALLGLGAAGALALGVIALAIRTMRVRNVLGPFGVEAEAEAIGNLAEIDAAELTTEHILDHYRERLSHLKNAVASFDQAVTEKAHEVTVCQALLGASLLCLVLVFLALVVAAGRAT